MEKNNRQLKSIWGKWWEPLRKWFYPTWVSYETSIRFYDYAEVVHNYFMKQQNNIAPYVGKNGAYTLDIFLSISTFFICTFFLTVPVCFVFYKFFKMKNLTDTQFEQKLKRLL